MRHCRKTWLLQALSMVCEKMGFMQLHFCANLFCTTDFCVQSGSTCCHTRRSRGSTYLTTPSEVFSSKAAPYTCSICGPAGSSFISLERGIIRNELCNVFLHAKGGFVEVHCLCGGCVLQCCMCLYACKVKVVPFHQLDTSPKFYHH